MAAVQVTNPYYTCASDVFVAGLVLIGINSRFPIGIKEYPFTSLVLLNICSPDDAHLLKLMVSFCTNREQRIISNKVIRYVAREQDTET